MKIKTILNQHRNDFTALMECEHCKRTEKLTTGYHDDYYHNRVIPAMYCSFCIRNRAGDFKSKGADEFQSWLPCSH